MTLQQLRYAVTIADCKSINKAATELFITQPSLSNTIKDLEEEIHIKLFDRSNRGIIITPEGEEFLGYARQMLDHYRLIEERFVENATFKKKFSVSTQHYTFAVAAFIELARKFGMEEYEFAIYETKTRDVIANVRSHRSEIGILYKNEFNDKFISKILRDNELEFVHLFECRIYVYMGRDNPLAGKERVDFADLQQYPCLSFEQGDSNSFYFAEEVLSTADYRQAIKVDDRSTMLNLMRGLNGYTLCSGIICEELNGEEYTAVPLDTVETMSIGYIKQRKRPLSHLGQSYVKELLKYGDRVL
ncbi:MAG: LysR family transcriptional regulator [Lachnospiraceae bacterium]|nr:LysR family transcriptional regulator [Lachnospiraceae bacterium]MDD7026022.1 LysR family transcriptional regulator [Lachnospiraceae bacterium]